ncbi:MAG: hypothetical protein ABEJ86_04155, partial [Halococcoides sp.]
MASSVALAITAKSSIVTIAIGRGDRIGHSHQFVHVDRVLDRTHDGLQKVGHGHHPDDGCLLPTSTNGGVDKLRL